MVKNLPSNAGDTRNVGAITGWGRSPGEGNGYPLEYSCLENSMDRGAWQAIVHGATKSWTHLSTHTHTHTPPLILLFIIFPPLGAPFAFETTYFPPTPQLEMSQIFQSSDQISFPTSEVFPKNPGWSSSVPLIAVSSLNYRGLCTYLATHMIFPSNLQAG